MPTTWRPHQHVRSLAIGIIRRGEDLLVVAVQEDSGAIKGWRPLGGTIEFGERAADTLKREFVEELGLEIVNPTLLTVMENLYEHHGVRGHEVVFVFTTAFVDQAGYWRDRFFFREGNVDLRVEWIDIGRFRRREEKLFPTGLIDRI